MDLKAIREMSVWTMARPWQFAALGATLCGALLAETGTVSAAEAIGRVDKVELSSYGTPPGGERERKLVAMDVIAYELIETGDMASILIELKDQTELYLGERASLVIDEFVYDPDAENENALYRLFIGTMRFVSGAMNERRVRIQTPTASIAIRGSDAIIMVTPEGATFISVFSGVFEITPLIGVALPVAVGANQNMNVGTDGTVSDIAPGAVIPDTGFQRDFDALRPGGSFAVQASGGSQGGTPIIVPAITIPTLIPIPRPIPVLSPTPSTPPYTPPAYPSPPP